MVLGVPYLGVEWEMLLGSTSVYLQILRFFIVLGVGIAVTRTVFMPIVRRLVSRRGAGKKTKHSVENIVGVVAVFVTFIAALQAAEFGGLVTVIGTVTAALTVAIGWGMRDQISSLVAGVFLNMYPSFVNGDYISSDDFAGTVHEVNLVDTVIKDGNGQKTRIPNSLLTTQPITNHTKGTVTQDEFTVTVRPEKREDAVSALEIIAEQHDVVRSTPAPTVVHDGIADGAVTTRLVYYIDDTADRSAVKTDLVGRFTDQAVKQDLLAAPDAGEEPDEMSETTR